MKQAFTVLGLAALLAGCASEDPYGGRGGTGTPRVSQFDSVEWGTRIHQVPLAPGGQPGTYPGDPHGGIGADDFGRRPQ